MMAKHFAVVLWLALLPFWAKAQEFVVDGVKYRVASPGEVAVVGYEGEGEEVVLPEVVTGDLVAGNREGEGKALGGAAGGGAWRVTSVAAGAFRGSAVRSVRFPQSLEAIDDEAFYGSQLEAVSIPAGVKEILGTSFASCEKLLTITVATGNYSYAAIDGVLFNYDRTRLVTIPGGRSGVYSIPDDVTVVERGALVCQSLEGLIVPASVKQIEGEPLESALDALPALRMIAIAPNSSLPYSTGEGQLLSKDGRQLLRCPQGWGEEFALTFRAKEIAEGAFRGCSRITTMELHEETAAISLAAFDKGAAIAQITCLGQTPPEIRNPEAAQNLQKLTLIVGKGAKGAFKKNPFWKGQKIKTVEF